jgi:serine/threonine protein kinase
LSSLYLLTNEGNWIGNTPIPEQTLETREMRLQGKDLVLLLALMRKLLRWLPEERPSAQDLFEDEFLLQYDVSEKDPEDDGLQEST